MKSRNSLLKALAAVMAASMILTVAGCGGGGNSSTAEKQHIFQNGIFRSGIHRRR